MEEVLRKLEHNALERVSAAPSHTLLKKLSSD
jgi:hypothetical protein